MSYPKRSWNACRAMGSAAAQARTRSLTSSGSLRRRMVSSVSTSTSAGQMSRAGSDSCLSWLRSQGGSGVWRGSGGTHLGEHSVERFRSHGLHQMHVEPRLLGLALVGLLAPARERDEANVRPPRLTADAPGDLVAVALRHADVDQRDVRTQ